MYSNLVKADYEIKDMNLKELRDDCEWRGCCI